MYSFFTFLELVKAISVHRAHRLLPEATLILRTWRNRPMKHVPEHEQLRGRVFPLYPVAAAPESPLLGQQCGPESGQQVTSSTV